MLTYYTPWLTSQHDTTHSSMSTPSSVPIIPTYSKHQHTVRPSHTAQFNLSGHITLTLHILHQSIAILYPQTVHIVMQPPNKQIQRVTTINVLKTVFYH